MAEGSTPQTPNIGGNGFIWILLMAAGTYFVAHQVPLEGSRPPAQEKSLSEQADVQDVDARLWQDPFAAVAEKLTKSEELRAKDCLPKVAGAATGLGAAAGPEASNAHCISPLDRPEANDSLVLIASVSAAPYAEDHEARRRTRYAILAGLNAEGYVPTDPQHIGFYRPQADRLPDQPPKAGQLAAAQFLQAQSAEAVQSPRTSPLPKIVPYEWFKPKPEQKNPAYRRILLLWFDEDALRESPLNQFAGLLCPTAAVRWANARILGPQTSTSLQAMVDEVNSGEWSKETRSKGICPERTPQFYVYSATADDATLIPGYVANLSVPNSPHDPSCVGSDTCLRQFFKQKGIELHRMIATDEALAGMIRDELKLRGIDNVNRNRRPSHIALVSEWDTVYGRAVPATMARCLGSENCQQANAGLPPWLHPYKYLRGLDGNWRTQAGRAPATAPRTRAASRTAMARPAPRRSPIPPRETAPRDRASSIISGVSASAYNNWMPSCSVEMGAASRPSGSSAPICTTNCSCCRRCGRCCRTPGSSPPIWMPCSCIRPRKSSRAISWSLRASACS
jgi:hypothetical protein